MIKNTLTLLVVLLTLTTALTFAGGGGKYHPELKTNPDTLKEFQDWRFGMFIHWGPVTLKGTEIGWSRGREVPTEEYDELYKQFNPAQFNAEEWVSIVKNAGMKYLVITTKHHDGFCLWPTQQRPWISADKQLDTPYSIAQTPFKRDILRELADACKKEGIAFCTYYSVPDWYHYDWTPRRATRVWEPTASGKSEILDFRPTTNAQIMRYNDFMKQQCKELIESYQPRLMWFDNVWPYPHENQAWTEKDGADIYAYLKGLDDKLVINNRLNRHTQGKLSWEERTGDWDTPEKKMGNYSETPWETCDTICNQWAWKADDNMKSFKTSMQILINAAGGNGNFLYNVGPTAAGIIEPRQASRLREMGDWLKQYGESIYETHGGPFKPQGNVLSTRKGRTIYIHLLNSEKQALLPLLRSEILEYEVLTGGNVELGTAKAGNTKITLDDNATREIDAIVCLKLKQSAMEIEATEFLTF
ncbi:alpha-L-fucosidase [Pontiella sulfatireligans]|uniref:alpha-L-fucosidase n=1 Tax=Pontiella sulfatireligans TaxID=2750658 RepID=A0A6C2UI48_9BACT|nr:alpha-L-fucosidase [Pontiella sulfatireligans]VGO19091.1 hypothetical protein SCARR_01147 [Pontiella sulfatireligans]